MLQLVANGFGLGEGGDFHHPPRRIDAENQNFDEPSRNFGICGALNRHFCQLKISEAKPVLCLRCSFLSLHFVINWSRYSL